MEVSLKEIEKKFRYVLENLFPYYVYEMSDFMQWDPNEKGKFTFKTSSLDPYWQRDDHIPYFICVDSALAGFVLVRKYPANEAVYDIEQFFVLRKYKGKGVGKQALKKVIESHRGLWQIRVLIENSSALCFWKSAVSNSVGTEFKLTLDTDIDVTMHFLRFEA